METTPDSKDRTVRLGPGREFDMIRRFTGTATTLPPDVRVGPGDDAAVIDGGWVISSDLAVEDVHFRRDWISDREIGMRVAAAALSDLAAMGATPIGVMVSMAAPRGGAVDVEAVQAGIREVAGGVGASVIGGDLSRSPGPLFLDLVVLGRTSWPVLRDGAEPGDHVWVSGALGGCAAAVHTWERGDEPSPELRARYATPRARIEEAQCLVEHELVDALIDLSDGLAGDVGHVAAASGVRVILEEEKIPIDPAARAALGDAAALDAALHGGEDYELCFVTDPGVVDPAYFEQRFGLTLTRVGRVTEGQGVWIEHPDGSLVELPTWWFRPLERGRGVIRLLGILIVIVPVTIWHAVRILWAIARKSPRLGCVCEDVPEKVVGVDAEDRGCRRRAGGRARDRSRAPSGPRRESLLVVRRAGLGDVPARCLSLRGQEGDREGPPFGPSLRRCGHIYIDREDRAKALESLERAREALENDRPTIIMFPEGTRSRSGELQRFKKGAFVLAIQTEVDVVPAAIIGSRDVMPKGSLLIRPGTIRVRFGDPIPVAGMDMDQRSQLTRQSRQAVAGLLGTPGS